jgi:uncharacterized protein (DUF1778 family)
MDSSRTLSPAGSVAPPSEEAKPGFRTKTIATRITPEELAEVEAAAERDGKSLAEWLRELVLNSARQRPTDPVELLLSEVAATRYMLLNLFHATAQANAEGKHLLPDSVLKIRDTADRKKIQTARKMLEEFFAQGDPEANQNQTGGRP